jgi:uncharacterized protein YrrD
VGHIDRVVLDPQTNQVAGVVVRKGFLFATDKVVPIDFVFQAAEDRVTLRQGVGGELKNLPDFEDTHYIPIDEAAADVNSSAAYASSLYWYPPIGFGTTYPGASAFPIPRYRVETDRNIPEGTIALKEGSRVLSSDDKHVGNVERVFMNAKTDKATHFLISQGLFFKERKAVPISWVRKIYEDEVHLTVSADLLDRLHGYEETAQAGVR